MHQSLRFELFASGVFRGAIFIVDILFMKPLRGRKHILSMMVVVVVIFAWIAPPIVAACGCACASGEATASADAPIKNASGPLISLCYCTNECPPEPPSNTCFAGADIQYACDMHPVCCCASGSGPQPAAKQSFLKDDNRPSFKEFQFQEALPSAFAPEIDPVIPRTIFAFERDLTRIPPHLSSTILLI